MTHTPEPWESGGIPVSSAEEIKRELLADLQQAIDYHTGSFGDYVMVIYRQDGARIAYLAGPTAEENCDRIVACVNACAGISTESLLEYTITDLSDIYTTAAKYDQLKQQNAALSEQVALLVAVIEDAYQHLAVCRSSPEEMWKLFLRIEAERNNAIAKAGSHE